MKKVWDSIARDLWIVLLDIVAVNATYFLALLVRFYVNFEFRPTVQYLIGDWAKFTPFYTVLSIVIFALFRLYGGMWRYAGINDMNRIIGASLCTAVLQVVGTMLFVRRMPITYYVIGAILQFLFISLIRFGYRILLVEKKKLSSRSSRVPAVVVGSGDLGRKVVKHLEDGGAYQPVAIIGRDEGRSLDGIPVTGFENIGKSLEKAKAVFIADKDLTAEQRRAIEEAAGDREIADYTGALSNMNGAVPVTGLLETISVPFTLVIDGQETKYKNGMEAIGDLRTRCLVTGIRGENLTVELVKDDGMAYLRQHQADTGEELSFF